MPESLSADVLRTWAQLARDGLARTRVEIDALNVFPVPDGDTGTNLFLTCGAAADAVERLFVDGGDPGRAEVAAGFASGALLGARGNSGVITSQILLGFSRALGAEPDGASDAEVLARGFDRAVTLAYAAVAQPREGTILSVIRAAAEAVRADGVGADDTAGAGAPDDPAVVARVALDAARVALERTPEQLEVLARAGVVDSGGAGCVVLLEALLAALTGGVPSPRTHGWGGGRAADQASDAERPTPSDRLRSVAYSGPEYEVMYLLEAPDAAIPALRDTLGGLGDSLVVVGDGGVWNVHVHVDDVGAAIEAGIGAGRPHRIKVTRLLADGTHAPIESGSRTGRALVAVAHGPGVRALLEASGAVVVMADPGQRPSTGELLDAALASGAREVVLLPSDSDTRAVADAAAHEARRQGVRAAVIPTRSIVQTLAAVAVNESTVAFEQDLIAMGRAAGATRYGAVTVAARQADTRAGTCRVGDVIGVTEGEISDIGADLPEVSRQVLGRLIGPGSELVTIVTGADVEPSAVENVCQWLARDFGSVEVDVVDGGQPNWPLIFGVE